MKKWIPALAVLALACNSENKPSDQPVVAAASTATPAAAATPKAAPDSATQNRNSAFYSAPGPEHKQLAEANGTWEAEISLRLSPGAPEIKMTSVTENKMLLGGRYQQSVSKGSFGKDAFEGIATTAFDNHKKQYISTWIDNMGTGMMVMYGTWDEATKTINFTGKMVEPGSAEEIDCRETFTLIDKDHQLQQMYVKGPDGKEFKSMQIHYSRKR